MISIKGSRRLILSIIVAGIIVSVIILKTFWPLGPENDIPNWMTMTVEVGIGVFIAALIYIMQGKTSDSLLEYNEGQKKLLRSLRLHSLERIAFYLSMAQDTIDFDKDRITKSDKTQQLDFVENLLSRHHDQFSDRGPHVVDQLQTEYRFVRPLVARIELEENLRSLIEKMQLLYGLKDLALAIADAQGDKVQKWLSLYAVALGLIKKTKKLVQEIQSAENDKAPPT